MHLKVNEWLTGLWRRDGQQKSISGGEIGW